jgi:hypothetical protein
MADADEPRAWPFMVARGRNVGYRTLLALDFLVDEQSYGLLSDKTSAEHANGEVVTVPVVTRRGTALVITYASRKVTTDDVRGVESGFPDATPCDAHGRPLRLIFGFACREQGELSISEADMAIAEEAALAAYREFLVDESGFHLRRSTAFSRRSELASAARVPKGTGRRLETRSSHVVREFTQSRATQGHHPLLVGVIGLGCVLLIGAAVWLMGGDSEPQPPVDPPASEISETAPPSPGVSASRSPGAHTERGHDVGGKPSEQADEPETGDSHREDEPEGRQGD